MSPPASTAFARSVLLSREGADALRDIRWTRGLSMDQCAAAMQMSVLEYLAKERGRKPFGGRELAVLLTLLQTDAAALGITG